MNTTEYITQLADKPYHHDTAHDDISDQDILDYAEQTMGIQLTDEQAEDILHVASGGVVRAGTETIGDAIERWVEAGK